MKILNLFREKSCIPNSQPITADSFFKEDNPHGYFLTDEFNLYLKSLDNSYLIRLNQLFFKLSNGIPCQGVELIFDKRANAYILWILLIENQKLLPISIPHSGHIHRFFKDYQRNRISVSLDLNQLSFKSKFNGIQNDI